MAAWRRRSHSPASRPFIWMMLAITGYALVAAFEAGAIGLPSKIFWSKLEYVGSGSVILWFLVFAIHFALQKQWLTTKKFVVLAVMPIANALLVATNEWHHLVWTGFSLLPETSNVVVYEHGPGFFWIMVWVYTYVLLGVILLAKAALRPGLLYQRQATMVLMGAIVPLLGGSAYMFDLTPPGLNVTPMSFMVTGVIYYASLLHYRLLDLVPVARDTLIETMHDGVLVVDARLRLVDINPAAQQLLGISTLSIGTSIETILARSQELLAGISLQTGKTLIRLNAEPAQYLEVQTTPLHNHWWQMTGHLLIVRDVTQRQQTEVELRQMNHQLQEQLRQIEGLQIQLREQAMRDRLTGLYNRRYFEESLSRELARAGRAGHPVALILMDLDYFKRINDTFGHLAGDRVLQSFADLLAYSSRSSDIACRYGGEEFVLTLPGMTLEAACQRAEQIRQGFAATQVWVGDNLIQTTLSAGVGTFPADGKTGEQLLQVIDAALYQAKARGRNCIQAVCQN